MSTFSPNLRIELIANGDQSGTWGTTTNTNLGTIIEDAISGYVAVVVTSANQAFTALNGTADEARNQTIRLTTTTTANFAVYAPPAEKVYVIINASAYTATIYASTVIGNTTAAGTGVAIPAGKKVLVYCDGTNFAEQLNYIVGDLGVGGNQTVTGNQTVSGNLAVTGTTTFTGIPSGPTASAGTSTTQLATTAFVTGASAAAVPTGTLSMWPTASAPSGYFICNGAAVSRTTYAALFAVLGTTFGAGDGSTTFNLPDYRDRMPIGAGTTYSAASTGGSKDAVVVSHTHTASVTDPGHLHTFPSRYDFTGGGSGFQSPYNGLGNTANSPVSTATTGISVSNSTAGVSGTNANLPPYLGIYFIIKA